jgi:pimeloyl-ACP methyl ester carboxylesterase
METATQERIRARAAPRGALGKLIATLPVKQRRFTLNGVVTSVLEGGAGTPIVLLHGPGGYGAQWVRVIPEMSKSHRVIAPDLPGHGTSEFFSDAPTPERVSAWLDDLIECTCSQPPVLVGHTLGGAIAARFAAESDRKLAALVLVDMLGLTAFQPQPAFGAALQSYLQKPDETTHDGLWSQCLFDLDGAKRRLGEPWAWIKEANLEIVRETGVGPMTAWMQQFGVAIPDELLRRIRTRTTLIWGREDRATPLSVAQAAAPRYAWNLEVIDGAADDPTLEQPEAFVSALRRAIEVS